jgi:hypothetical protein
MTRELITLDSCLFNAFNEPDPGKAQEPQQIWAVVEGTHRIDRNSSNEWKIIKAVKEHECMRGCKIQPGDRYAQYILFGYTSGWKVCAGCMAMILYFMQAAELPPATFTHWDPNKNEPVSMDLSNGV